MRIRQKALALLLAAVLALTALPGAAFAEEDVSALTGEAGAGLEIAETWLCGGSSTNNPDDSVTAVLDSEGTLTVSGNGAMCDYDDDFFYWQAPWKARSGEIKRVVVEDGVTHIGDEAFLACPNLESVQLAGSVRTVGQQGYGKSFAGCPRLTRLVILPGDGCEIRDQAFANCPLLTEVSLGEGVVSIGYGAFASCSGLKAIQLPESLTAMGDCAFEKCSGLVALKLPEKLTSIGQSVFINCAGLTAVELPEGLASIGSMAFYNCAALAAVKFPDSLTSIGRTAFSECAALEEVILPKNLTDLGYSAFYDSGVRRIAVPEGLTIPSEDLPSGAEVRTYTGETPEDFASIPVETPGGNPGGSTGENPGGGTGENPGGNTGENPGGSTGENPGGSTGENPGGSTGENPGGSTGENPGGGTGENPGGSTGENPGGETPVPPAEIVKSGECGKNGNNVTWTLDENGLLTIRGTGEMKDYSSISRGPRPWGEDNVNALVVEEGVTKVGGYAFHQHTALKSVQLPESLTAIGSNAFEGCAALPSVTIPQAVTSLGYNTFSGCESLTEARVHRQLKQIPSNVFPAACTVTRYGTAGGECGKNGDNVTWTLDENGLLTIRGTGEMEDYTGRYGPSDRPWDIAAVKSLAVEDGVSGIGAYAFYGCEGLESAELPESVQTVGKYAFYNSGLTRARVHYQAKRGSGAFPASCVLSLYGKNLTPEEPLRASRTAPVRTGNLHMENYNGRYNRPSRSGLYAGENGGFYRVEYSEDSGLVMEEYGSGGVFYQGWDIPMELPLFGGFFSGSDGFYFVFGQENPGHSDSVEVLRVVKYTKDLERLGDARVLGGYTAIPFDAGSCRMDEGNGLLYIHASHEMYDGHQSCMVFTLDTNVMEFQYWFYEVANPAANGYVSHSFNQFIRVDGTRVVRLDHGDGAPRGAGLFVNGPSLAGQPQYAVIYPWSGGFGENATGASVGGLEVSPSAYLSALSSVDQNSGKKNNNRTYNVYLLATDKETGKTSQVQLTHYTEGGAYSASTPQLVKLSDDRFLLLWEEQARRDYSGGYYYSEYTGTVKYAFFDGEGNQQGGVQSMDGALSDCQPAAIDGKAVWYTTERRFSAEDRGYVMTEPVFYQIGSDGTAGSFTPTTGQKPPKPPKPTGESVTLPEEVRKAAADGTAVLAASYSGGKLTERAQGTVKDGKAVFDRKLPAGRTLYFLDQDGRPLCRPFDG